MKLTYDLRTIFNQAASDYEETRPGYPMELIQDIITISNIPENSQIIVYCQENSKIVVSDEFAPSWWTLADAAGNEVDIATIKGRD